MHSTVSLPCHAGWKNTLNTPAPGYLAVDIEGVDTKEATSIMDTSSSTLAVVNDDRLSVPKCEIKFHLKIKNSKCTRVITMNITRFVRYDSLFSHGCNRMRS